jgi:hypothetical protein
LFILQLQLHLLLFLIGQAPSESSVASHS